MTLARLLLGNWMSTSFFLTVTRNGAWASWFPEDSCWVRFAEISTKLSWYHVWLLLFSRHNSLVVESFQFDESSRKAATLTSDAIGFHLRCSVQLFSTCRYKKRTLMPRDELGLWPEEVVDVFQEDSDSVAVLMAWVHRQRQRGSSCSDHLMSLLGAKSFVRDLVIKRLVTPETGIKETPVLLLQSLQQEFDFG